MGSTMVVLGRAGGRKDWRAERETRERSADGTSKGSADVPAAVD